MCHSLEHGVEVFLDLLDIACAHGDLVSLNLQNDKYKMPNIEFAEVLDLDLLSLVLIHLVGSLMSLFRRVSSIVIELSHVF